MDKALMTARFFAPEIMLLKIWMEKLSKLHFIWARKMRGNRITGKDVEVEDIKGENFPGKMLRGKVLSFIWELFVAINR